MSPDPPSPSVPSPPSLRRRDLLAGLAGGGLLATSGCIRQLRSLANRDTPEQISLSIKTVPADADPRSTRIARQLSSNLNAVGIETSIVPMTEEELLRDTLLNQSFDIYVMRHPATDGDTFLYSLLHSRFDAEPGWQNPFGYANLGVDDLLDTQRRQAGTARVKTLHETQSAVARDQPFTPVAIPNEIRATQGDRFAGWSAADMHSTLGYLRLRTTVDVADSTTPTNQTTNETATTQETTQPPLRMTLKDSRATRNLNPIAVEFRGDGDITDLLYDPLARRIDGDLVPWLASSWEWMASSETGTTAELTLRDDLQWHDGTPITAADVSFTYRFLNDTSVGELESPVPAPRFRDRSSLVADAVETGDRTVRIEFEAVSRDVATAAFTLPLLPKHIWETKTGQATIAGLDTGSGVTEALIWSNEQPIGSGPLRFESSEAGASLTLVPFTEHFLSQGEFEGPLAPYQGGFKPSELEFTVVPSDGAALALLEEDEVDATASPLGADVIADIGSSDALRLHVSKPSAFYHVGFNVRESPLSNPRFRRAVAQLLDKQYIVSEVFGGYAEPIASPLAPYPEVAPNLVWTDTDPELPFPGEDGTLDVELAKESFREAGFRYNESGELLRR
ncbi:ABC transporter substrate-binding protein [Haladaptatus sp. ZSTT2]|uniref:ABC transporter substrate-binding protein n=1 Tax=Haladaptatus sp. ZSTT2 TaxID=3120515 RepID=UPI00300F6393